jgi:HTH-type transcriptional regulator/antitoxin HigA
MQITPILNEKDYEAALAEVERLFAATPGTSEGDRLHVWTTLVEAYESAHYPIPLPDPIDFLHHHLESRGISHRDLGPFIGSEVTVAEVLNRERPLTINMIRRLHDGLGISAEILIQPYRLVEPVA